MSDILNRPFVVCHMLTSMDGKIDGSYMSDPACAPALAAYGRLRQVYQCHATLYGTVTMLGSFADGPAPKMKEFTAPAFYEDYLAFSDVTNYIVSVDPKGELGFSSGYIEKKGRPRAHIIEVLTEQVSNEYLAYLRKMGVSYVFAGAKHINCGLLLEKLQTKFGIEKLMIAGGGYMNYSFLHENLIDELSLVIAPLADGNTKSVSVFEQSDFLSERAPSVFTLKEVQKLDGDALWLRYSLKK